MYLEYCLRCTHDHDAHDSGQRCYPARSARLQVRFGKVIESALVIGLVPVTFRRCRAPIIHVRQGYPRLQRGNVS
jgi:hypothetical protein